MMKYSKPIDKVKADFLPWVEQNITSKKMKTDSFKFEHTITDLEQQVGKLLPEFTKEDVIVYLKSRPKVSALVVRNFYNRCKTWLAYCKDTNCYDREITDEDVVNTVMYNVHIREYEDLMVNQTFIRNEEEFDTMLAEYIYNGGQARVALSIMLIWHGYDAEAISAICLRDINLNISTITICNSTLQLESKVQRGILEAAYHDTLKYYGEDFVAEANGEVLVMRGKYFRDANEPLNRNVVYQRHVPHFADSVGRDLTLRQISTSGKFYRWYLREQAGETLQFTNDGSRTNFDELTNYKAYKQFVESSNQ